MKQSPIQTSSQTSIKTEKKKIEVFIAGTGAIGSTLIRQIQEWAHDSFTIQVTGVCNSRFMVWEPDGNFFISPADLQRGLRTDWDYILQNLTDHYSRNLVFVDATGSDEVARLYKTLLEKGIHVVTPSKKANTFEQAYFDDLKNLAKLEKVAYLYETAVGAGLPVISTIKTLLNSGDEITEINGVVSGTMTYLFNQIQNGKLFSEAVRQAKDLGYSEPDPRDDLSGEDVARKFLILARTCNFPFERDQIKVQSLVPAELAQLSSDEFLSRLSEADSHWKQLNAKAIVNNTKLRYAGKFSPDGIEVGVQEVKAESPLGALKGTDNLIQIYTKRYSDSPIVIQGPGAGKEVTAAGVLGDLVSIFINP